jgi:sugar lactone lactonase YvrE
VPDSPITDLGKLTLTATAASGGNDTVVFFNGTNAYNITASDSVLSIATVWNQSEFNVVGDAGSSQAQFNAGSVITVNVAAQYGSTTTPTCPSGAGTTGETNNLNLLPCSATGGATTSIQFIESLLTNPTISKAFNPTSIIAGGTSTVTLTLTNPNTGIILTGANFTDTLAGMSAAGGAVGGTCTGTTPAILSAGVTALSFSGIAIPAGGSCTVTFSVTSISLGSHPNSTSGVSSDQALTGDASNTVSLSVTALPATISKAFSPTTITTLGTSTVMLTLANPNVIGLTGAAFTDTLVDMSAFGGAVVSTCAGIAPTSLTAGATALSFSGITLPANGSCTIAFTVASTHVGMHQNSTSGVSTNQAATGSASNIADLTVIPGTIYISDSENNRIRPVNTVTGTISTLAGNGTGGFTGDGGLATGAELKIPYGVAVDSSGNTYIADSQNNRVRKVSTTGTITTVAGSGFAGSGGDGGSALSALLNNPTGAAVDAAGNLYIADQHNNKIRVVNTLGVISTFAGTGSVGNGGDGGPASAAALYYPTSVALDGLGNLYIADTNNQRIRKVNISTGIITTVAGSGSVGYGCAAGVATAVGLHNPYGVAADGGGNIYIADTYLQCIRKVASGNITTVAGNGLASFSGDGGPATSAALNYPTGVAVDGIGNIYIADLVNSRVRMITPGGIITTLAGTGVFGFSGDGGPATAAELYNPSGVVAH